MVESGRFLAVYLTAGERQALAAVLRGALTRYRGELEELRKQGSGFKHGIGVVSRDAIAELYERDIATLEAIYAELRQAARRRRVHTR